MGRSTTKVEKDIEKNAKKVKYFVKWYVDSDKKKESYNEVCAINCAVSYETAMSEWLLREDVQTAIKNYLKSKRAIKMLDIYNAMYDKAITKGDVNSAKWCETFFKSDFFEDSQDEINDYLGGIELPALQKSGEK